MKRSFIAASVFVLAIGAASFTHAGNKVKINTYYDQNTCQQVTLPSECTNGSHVCTLSNGDPVALNSCTGTIVSKP